MAFTKEIKVDIDPDLNVIFDEKPGGNSFLALRKVRWSEDGKFKLDVRKWYTNAQGEEIAGKGISFMTEEGPSNLIQGLLENGYGDTRQTLNALENRDDFFPAIKEIITRNNVDLDKVKTETLDDVDSFSDFYDPKSIL